MAYWFKLAVDQRVVPVRIDEEIPVGKRENVRSQPRWSSSHFELVHNQSIGTQNDDGVFTGGIKAFRIVLSGGHIV
jgi:hypothetical protein